jgi:signal transduction histidine kinase
MADRARRPLKVLILEDSFDDAELLLLELERAEFDVSHRRVETGEDLRNALATEGWDIIISDYSMPSLDAPAALAILHASGLDIPFIIVSGTVGEETAVAALRAGAQDFLVKGRLARLAPAIEREVREAKGRQDRRVEQRAANESLRARLQAEAASAAKSQFLANASHELRTPLNAIIGFSELLVDGKVGALTAQQADFVQNVLDGGRYLLRLINDLLDLSKVESGRFELMRVPTAVGRLLPPLLERLQPLLTRSGLSCTVSFPDGLPMISADPTRLTQVFFNLLANAIKFTPKGGRIDITVRSVAGGVEVDVRDTGVGIAADDLPRLFREFEQLKAGIADRENPGTGLGLALSKRLVELHGGTIAVESAVGAGTTFTVALPASRE